MFLFKAIVLAVVEGLTEFLPISSTGHLILAESVLSLSDKKCFNDAYIVLIQLPAILAVVVYFWNRLWPFTRDTEQRRLRFSLWFKVCVAFVPAAIAGLLFDDYIESKLLSELPVAIALVFGGIAFIVLERLPLSHRFAHAEDIGWRTALGIGALQCLALFPGVSRSGASILGAMILGASRPAAAEFSFFLAIPTMAGAWALTVLKSGLTFTVTEWTALAVGSVVSFVVAYAVIAFLMRFVQQHRFTVFGYYRIILGGLVLVAQLMR